MPKTAPKLFTTTAERVILYAEGKVSAAALLDAYREDTGKAGKDAEAVADAVLKATWPQLGIKPAASARWKAAGVLTPFKAFALERLGITPAHARQRFRGERLGEAYEAGDYSAANVEAVLFTLSLPFTPKEA